MKLSFGNMDDLIFKKKIDHFSKRMTLNRLEIFCNGSPKFSKKFDIFQERLEKIVAEISEILGENTLYEHKEKRIKEETKHEIENFLKKNVLPSLIKEGYFKSYKIPIKMKGTNPLREWRQK